MKIICRKKNKSLQFKKRKKILQCAEFPHACGSCKAFMRKTTESLKIIFDKNCQQIRGKFGGKLETLSSLFLLVTKRQG